MSGATSEPRLPAIQAGTLFELTDSGRLRHENSPDRRPAPRLWLAGSADGNLARIGVDVGAETAREIEALVASEPLLREPDAEPVHLDAYTALLDAEAPVEEVGRGITYTFPDHLRYEHRAHIVESETSEGAQLLARVEAEGVPEGLFEMGFTDATHFWPPWCVALHEGTIVSIAFTARMSSDGAEVGVATAPAYRRRGLAVATTAEWASLPSLSNHVLFYSTDTSNLSSLRVADRLELPFVGTNFSIR